MILSAVVRGHVCVARTGNRITIGRLYFVKFKDLTLRSAPGAKGDGCSLLRLNIWEGAFWSALPPPEMPEGPVGVPLVVPAIGCLNPF